MFNHRLYFTYYTFFFYFTIFFNPINNQIDSISEIIEWFIMLQAYNYIFI